MNFFNYMQHNISPIISRAEWGKIEINDSLIYKDVKCFPGGSREWDWNETGTRHTPGIQLADIEELLEKEAEVLVLSMGYRCRLKTDSRTIEFLDKQKIPLFWCQHVPL